MSSQSSLSPLLNPKPCSQLIPTKKLGFSPDLLLHFPRLHFHRVPVDVKTSTSSFTEEPCHSMKMAAVLCLAALFLHLKNLHHLLTKMPACIFFLLLSLLYYPCLFLLFLSLSYFYLLCLFSYAPFDVMFLAC